jgi:hypothetical protein
MRSPLLAHGLVAVAGTLVILGHAPPSDAQVATQEKAPPVPLTCRGGSGVVFDTIMPRSDTGRVVKLSLTFAANPIAAGAEGQKLQPGTCAWSDRPLSDTEPRRVRFSIHYTDSTPGLTIRDTSLFWSFLIESKESGHLVGRGYRHWHASSPPGPMAAPQLPAGPNRRGWLPFRPIHLPWLVLAWVMLVGVPMSLLTGSWSGWRRLAGLYPDCDAGRGRSFSCGSLVMGRANYRGGVRARADDSHLHLSAWILFRPGHPPFSVPWSDITATRDGWPWLPFKGMPVIRLTLGRYPSLRILVPRKVGERIVAESGGRLHLNAPAPPPLVAR